MPQALSVATAIERSRLSSDVPLLVALEIDVVEPRTGNAVETLRFVRNDEEIVHQGNTYVPVYFDISFGSEAGATPTVELTVRETTGALQARMEEYDGGVGFGVRMLILNADRLAEEPEVSERFEVMTAAMKDYEASFSLGSENDIAKTFPRRAQTRDFCQWRFRDPATCGYSGPLQTCDLTLQGPNGCNKHSNVIRFGGYPGLNASDVRYG